MPCHGHRSHTWAVSTLALPKAPGSRASVSLKSLVPTDKRSNGYLPPDFLFGSRCLVRGRLPIFFRLLDWSHGAVGGFLALWIIGYGMVQASAPVFIHQLPVSQQPPSIRPGKAPSFPSSAFLDSSGLTNLVLSGALCSPVFAVNSAVHSYLVVAAAEDTIALNVGFTTCRMQRETLGTFCQEPSSVGRTRTSGLTLAFASMVLVGSLLCIPLNKPKTNPAAN